MTMGVASFFVGCGKEISTGYGILNAVIQEASNLHDLYASYVLFGE